MPEYEEKRYRIYLCAGLHCTPGGRAALLKTLEHALWEHALDNDTEIRSSSCLNRCEYAPNMTIWPGPIRYAALTPEAIRQIVVQHLRDGVVVEELLFRE
jgi:(2Fe-2S) ferredoxin